MIVDKSIVDRLYVETRQNITIFLDPIPVKKLSIEPTVEENRVKEDVNTTEVNIKEAEEHYPTKKPSLFNFSDDEDEEFFKDLKIKKKLHGDIGVRGI